jgi:REP element-mobilizing transposase RayT
MPRKPRLFIEGGVYHVYCRTSRGDPIFLDDAEAVGFVDTIQRVKQRDGLIVYAWCLMSNHYHLAVRTTEIPLWRSMASLQGQTAKRFNRSHRVFGPLWQGRYKAKPVEDQRYLDQLMVYIHLNPVVADVVDDPADHPWSGHRELLGMADLGVIDRKEALAPFGPTLGRARKAYVRALRADHDAEWMGERPGHLPWWGRAKRDEDDGMTPLEGIPYVDYLGRSTAPERPRLRAEQFLEQACERLGVDLELLAGRGKSPAARDLRELVSVLGVERYRQRVSELADSLGKNPGSVSRWVSAGAARRADEPHFARRLEELDRALQKAGKRATKATL